MVPVAAVRARDRELAFFVVLTGAERSLMRAGSREFRPPEPDPPEGAVTDLPVPGPDDPYTD
jgi:hypothetical protein